MMARRTLNFRVSYRVWLGVWLGVCLASAAAMIWGSASGNGVLVAAAAGCFGLSAVAGATLWNLEVWRRPASADADANANARLACDALRRNALASATAYGWGALTMQGVYITPLTGLKWQHGWQYALVMALLGAGSLAFARTLQPALPGADRRGWVTHFRWACRLAFGQGLVAAVGLGALVASGKLWSIRADWAANRVFAALAVAILAISIATCASHRRLLRDGAAR